MFLTKIILTHLYPLVSLEGDARVRLDVEEGFMDLVVWVEAVHRLAEAGVGHVEVGAAAKGRRALNNEIRVLTNERSVLTHLP